MLAGTAASVSEQVDVSSDRPGETPAEHADRNFSELLQELRVAQTGVQILLAFLLTIPFSVGFSRISHTQRGLFAASVVTTAIAMALLVSPVACHRLAFRQRRKELILAVSHRMTLLGLAALALAVLGSLLLALSVALSGVWAAALTLVAATTVFCTWVVLPLLIRAKQQDS